MSPKKSSRQHFEPTNTDHSMAVKSALHMSMVPDNILCRDAEQNKLFNFCKDHILQQQPGSLYVCGCPGTGKSLLIEKVKVMSQKWAEESGLPAPDILSFNCATLMNPSDLFEQILGQLSPSPLNKRQNLDRLKRVKDAVRKSKSKCNHKMLILIVDEVDYLLGKDHSVLHELFKLPAVEESRCIIIGISNSIDLADRILPQLSCFSCFPLVIPFCPYTKDQILIVLKQRLKELPFNVFDQAALELCARRVSAASGDMRKALHICRLAVELLESEECLEKPVEIRYSSSQKSIHSPSKNMGLPRERNNVVLIHHMAQALAKSFHSTVVETVKALPKHQQMVLCAAVHVFRQKKKDSTVGQLNAGYLDFCKMTDMPALSVPEFSSVCRVLADQGLLYLGSSKEDRLRRVTLSVDAEDIVFALQGIRFFSNHLS